MRQGEAEAKQGERRQSVHGKAGVNAGGKGNAGQGGNAGDWGNADDRATARDGDLGVGRAGSESGGGGTTG